MNEVFKSFFRSVDFFASCYNWRNDSCFRNFNKIN